MAGKFYRVPQRERKPGTDVDIRDLKRHKTCTRTEYYTSEREQLRPPRCRDPAARASRPPTHPARPTPPPTPRRQRCGRQGRRGSPDPGESARRPARGADAPPRRPAARRAHLLEGPAGLQARSEGERALSPRRRAVAPASSSPPPLLLGGVGGELSESPGVCNFSSLSLPPPPEKEEGEKMSTTGMKKLRRYFQTIFQREKRSPFGGYTSVKIATQM
ncbi:serine/arginine repetitive matrix protein 1-like [Acomys russatus]|uniref:serine/arginine repetitive matrix protein 1-like n=1 Tax=Acomys russatus TaxID=60746 RepID=UPI0021E24A11|nr:serine/arginine repetitive matrix protein 1-like [Acomys russatus]